jgi:hypothetical protein
MVKAGKMMWAETVKANWRRARSIAEKESVMSELLSRAVHRIPLPS